MSTDIKIGEIFTRICSIVFTWSC